MKNVGLVLEGGGMRGVYTAGVLDAFIDQGIEIPYVIGVSSGATIGSSYVAKQKERCKNIYINWSQDKRFGGLWCILKERSFFSMNFIFDQLPNELEPFDYNAFETSDAVFMSCLSNCDTGQAEYFNHKNFDPEYYMTKVVRACNSLPIISPPVKIDGHRYLDGFLTDPLPLMKSQEDGNTYNIVVLTKKAGIGGKISWTDKFFKKLTMILYPKLGRHVDATVTEYLRRIEALDDLESQGKVIVFRPKSHRLENRYTRDAKALEAMYQEGYDAAIAEMARVKTWMA